MHSRIMETLERLEEKIESIKWRIIPPFHIKRTDVSEAINIIRRSAGILGRDFAKGTTYENKIRKEWKTNFRKRA